VISKMINQGLWVPPAEAAAAIGAALCAHWAAAKAVAAKNPFWSKTNAWPSSWLERSANPLSAYHLTIGGKLMRYASGSASVPNPNRVPRS
jgi:hypothetical protein